MIKDLGEQDMNKEEFKQENEKFIKDPKKIKLRNNSLIAISAGLILTFASIPLNLIPDFFAVVGLIIFVYGATSYQKYLSQWNETLQNIKKVEKQ